MAERMPRLTRDQLSRMGFKEHPFRSSADPRFLFLSSLHEDVLARLQGLVEWREGLGVIEGPIGTGKTSVARRLYELTTQDEQYRPVYIHTATYNTQLDAARDIARHFGLDSRRAYTDQLRDLEGLLVALRQEEVTPVVIIDDAQLMSSDSLETIQNILNFDLREKLMQIVLFGQLEVHLNFAKQPALLDRVAYWTKLGALPFNDMVGLLNFRLNVAGRAEPLFTDAALTALFEFSSGVPRPLIIVCNEVLRTLATSGRDEADEADITAAIEIYNQRPGRDFDGQKR